MDIKQWIKENTYAYGDTQMVSVEKLLEFLNQPVRESQDRKIGRKDKKASKY